MALVLANRVQETTTTTGTGTVTLAGAVSGFQSFAVIGNGNTTYYTITSGSDWEVGIGTYTSSGTTLSRDTVLSSSAAGAKITLAGTSTVFVTYPSEDSVYQDGSTIKAGSAVLPVSNGGTGTATLATNNVLLGNGTSALQVVAPGTSSNVLTSNGTTWTSTAPAGGGSLILLESVVASSSATVSLSAFSSTYDDYIIYADNFVPVTSGADLRMRINSKTADYSWVYQSLASNSTSETVSNASTTGTFLPVALGVTLRGGAIVDIANRSTNVPMIIWRSSAAFSGGQRLVFGTGRNEDLGSALSSVTFLMSTGNISSGNFRLYGIKKV